MVPKTSVTTQNVRAVSIPTATYKVLIDMNRMQGETDGLEAMKQAVYLVLSTERYEYSAYSWNYGIELRDLFGQPINYVEAVLKYRIEDALSMDDRILEVRDFEFSHEKKKTLTVSFTVRTNQGDFTSAVEVNI